MTDLRNTLPDPDSVKSARSGKPGRSNLERWSLACVRWLPTLVLGCVAGLTALAAACGPRSPVAAGPAGTTVPLPPPIGTAAGTAAGTASPPAATARAAEEALPLIREEASGKLIPDRMAMIALDTREARGTVSATGAWSIAEQGGRVGLVKGVGGEAWRIEQRGKLLRVAGKGSDATPWRQGPFVVKATGENSFLRFGIRRYRGELVFSATDSGILVVNRLPVEDYLKGVVPIEIGTRQATDMAAVEAQVIAARSYSYMRIPHDLAQQPPRGWHMSDGVQFQLYGGMDVEHPLVNEAVNATAGMVLRYRGLIVDAPYFSSCGGRTAAPGEAWRDARDEPYLQPVDDIDPRTGRPYCDLSSRNHWDVTFDGTQLQQVVSRALRSAGASNPRPATVLDMEIGGLTASGRVASLVIQTDRGSVRVAARDIRSVLGDARGGILASTYFSVDRESRDRDHLTRVTLHGAGNGHGVGMCQWGAIGRARAGIDARSILRHYYPGTVVDFAD